MEPISGARTFTGSGASYDGFMGRYSRLLAIQFADAAEIGEGQRVLDVGCGTGALTGVLVDRVGLASVAAVDPSPSFVSACTARYEGLDVRAGSAEAIPFDDASFDAAMAQLVLHFVSDPDLSIAEMTRVVRSGGVVAACVWDFEHGMEMLRAFWDAALTVDPAAPDEAQVLQFGRSGEVVELLVSAGLEGVVETTLEVESSYADFDELWSGFLAGIGPAGAYCVSRSTDQQTALRDELFKGLGEPSGAFTMKALARCATGRKRD